MAKRIKPYDRKVKQYGEFKTWIQYVGDEDRPGICIARTGLGRMTGCWVIDDSMLPLYVDSDGSHSEYMQMIAPRIAEHIGLYNSKDTAFKIAEAILLAIEDAIAFPPPTYDETPDTEVTLNVNGDSITTEVSGG